MRTGRPPKGVKVTRVCEVCGNTWEAYPWDQNRLKYCSRECWRESRIGKPSLRHIVPTEKHCAYCGKGFLVGGTGNRRKITRYCSKVCSRHGSWQGKGGHTAAKQMSREDCIWLAGFFDGEGCIGWPRRHIIHSVYLSITNTFKPAIDRVSKMTGTGRVAKRTKKSIRHTQAYCWNAYGENARIILLQILPWLIIKKRAAEIALGVVQSKSPPWTQRTKSMRKLVCPV